MWIQPFQVGIHTEQAYETVKELVVRSRNAFVTRPSVQRFFRRPLGHGEELVLLAHWGT